MILDWIFPLKMVISPLKIAMDSPIFFRIWDPILELLGDVDATPSDSPSSSPGPR
jgi:hypothetical protein